MAVEYDLSHQEGWNPKEIIEEIKTYVLERFPKLDWNKVFITKLNDRRVIITQSDDEDVEKKLHIVHQELLRNKKLTKGHARGGL